jgi:hypothetical protein
MDAGVAAVVRARRSTGAYEGSVVSVSTKERLRDRMIDLRATERELQRAIDETKAVLEANRAEQEQVKHLLTTAAETSLRLPVDGTRAGRRVLAGLGTFTMSNAKGVLGWKQADVKKLIELLEIEKPPAIERLGAFEGQRMFRYIGPPVEDDPVADAESVGQDRVREWALAQKMKFTPGEAARACDTSRTTALRMLRHMQTAGALVDEGPTQDMPIFGVAGKDGKVIEPPRLTVVESEPRVSSPIPQIQEMLTAAYAAGLDVGESHNHFTIESPDSRVLVSKKFQGRQQLMEDRARVRRLGANL